MQMTSFTKVKPKDETALSPRGCQPPYAEMNNAIIKGQLYETEKNIS